MSAKKETIRRTSPRTAHNNKISEETAARLKRQKTPLYPPSFTNPITKTSLSRPSTRLSTSSIASGNGSGVGGSGSPHHVSSRDSISSGNNQNLYGHSSKKRISPKNKQPSSPRSSTNTNGSPFTNNLMKTKRYVTKYNSPKNASPTSGSQQTKTSTVSTSSFTPLGMGFNSPSKSSKTKINNEHENANNDRTTLSKKLTTTNAETAPQQKSKSSSNFFNNENIKNDKNFGNDQMINEDISNFRRIRRISFEPKVDQEFEIAKGSSIENKSTDQEFTSESFLGNYSEPIMNKSNYLIHEKNENDENSDNSDNREDYDDEIDDQIIKCREIIIDTSNGIHKQPISGEQSISSYKPKNANEKAEVTNVTKTGVIKTKKTK